MDVLHYIANVGRCIHAYSQSITSLKEFPVVFRTEHSTQHKTISIKRCQGSFGPPLSSTYNPPAERHNLTTSHRLSPLSASPCRPVFTD
jgi:hypothetical protein